MNLLLEYSVRDPVFMLYAIELIFKTLFHLCEGGIHAYVSVIWQNLLCSPPERRQRDKRVGHSVFCPGCSQTHRCSHQPIKGPSAPARGRREVQGWAGTWIRDSENGTVCLGCSHGSPRKASAPRSRCEITKRSQQERPSGVPFALSGVTARGYFGIAQGFLQDV